MKKKFFFTLLFGSIFLSTLLRAESFGEVVPKEFELRKGAREAWTQVKGDWFRNVFPVCLKKERLRLSCSKCESIYLRSKFDIDSNGKLIGHEVSREKMCEKSFNEPLKRCFLDYFENYQFPPVLRELKFEVQLGDGLSC